MERQTPHCGCECASCSQDAARKRHEREDCTFVHVPTTAIVYIAMQEFQNIYDPGAGFSRGTVFADLDKPLLAGGVCRGKP